MPQKQTYNSNADRQRAYRERIKQASQDWMMGAKLPDRCALSNVPSEKRWRALVDSAHASLLAVEEEMDDYGSQRSDQWHEGERAERFAERMLAIRDMAEALDNLIQEVFD